MERVRTIGFLERPPAHRESIPLVHREASLVPPSYTPLRRTILPGHDRIFFNSPPREHPSSPPKPKKPKNERLTDRFFNWYFDRFPPTEREITFYKMAGVKIFKFFVPNNGQLVNRIFKAPKLNTQNREALEKRIEHTKYGERMHLMWVPPILAGGIGLSIAFPLFSPLILLATAGVELGANGYPIMLQRFNRFLATQRLNMLHSPE